MFWGVGKLPGTVLLIDDNTDLLRLFRRYAMRGGYRVLEATHDLFTAAVRDALMHARFTPATVGGRKVRQLVEQTFTFSITR